MDRRCLAALACLGWLLPAAAQEASSTPEPKVQRVVIEDDGTRIEELRVRGQTVRIVVQPKAPGVRPYEIVPATGGRDLSTGPHAERGAAGQRVWNVLSF